MVRIAFQALHDYTTKTKRNIQEVEAEHLAAALQEVDTALSECPESPWRTSLNQIFGGNLNAEQQTLALRDLFVNGYKPAQRCEKVYAALERYMSVIGTELTQRYLTKPTEEISDILDLDAE